MAFLPLDVNLAGSMIPGPSRSGSNGNKEVPNILQKLLIWSLTTKCSLVSNPGYYFFPMGWILTGTTTSGQSGLGSNGNEGVYQIP